MDRQAVTLPFEIGAYSCGGDAPLAVGHVGGQRAVLQDRALRYPCVGDGLVHGQILAVRQVVYEGQHWDVEACPPGGRDTAWRRCRESLSAVSGAIDAPPPRA